VAVASRSAAAQLDHHLLEIAPDPEVAAAAAGDHGGVVDVNQYRQYRLAAATLELQVSFHYDDLCRGFDQHDE
jgi:hypothetical protein